MSASTCNGAGFDTQISVFKGSCGSLECVDGNNDACNSQSLISWSTTQGELYYILVHGFNSASGDFSLQVKPNQVGYNPADFCVTAVPLPYNETVDISFQYATGDAGVPDCLGACEFQTNAPIGVWYTSVGTGSVMTITLGPEVIPSAPTSTMGILTGSSCSGLQCVAANCTTYGSTSSNYYCDWQTVKGENYYFFVNLCPLSGNTSDSVKLIVH